MIANCLYVMSKGYAPVIRFKDSENHLNLWEQFYLQPYHEELFDSEKCAIDSVCDIKRANVYFPVKMSSDDISLFSDLYRVLAVLNTPTREYISKEINSIIKNKRVIGVLCRGTDYTANKPAGHPVQPSVKDVIEEVRNLLTELSCDYIYVATEEKRIFQMFQSNFKGRVLSNDRLYYDDFYKMKNEWGEKTRISCVHHDRENDNYYKSLEYLSSIYILSECTALIAGNTGGSRMATILNNNRYEYCHLYDLGLY